ncbi:MAG: LAGLIDADG family homing endonuclease [archaeon]
MQALSPLEVENINLLRSNGFGYKRIARELALSPATVFKYSRNFILSDEAMRAIEEVESRTRSKFAASFAVQKQIKYPIVDENFANLLGRLFFDGSVNAFHGKYTISYTNASLAAVNKFIENVEICFGIECGAIQCFKGVNVDWYQVEAYSKRVYDYLVSISPTFSTSNNVGIPEQILCSSYLVKAAFLRAFWDDEGCIADDGELSGTSKSERMIDDLIRLHGQLDIKCVKRIKTNPVYGDIFHLVVKRNKTNFREFIEKVNFEHGIITKGHNIGKHKKHVLVEKFNGIKG